MRLWTLLLTGCGYISQAERDARWDLDGDGIERPEDCDDQDAAVGAEDCGPTDPVEPVCGEPPVARLSLGAGVAEVGALALAADGSASTGQALGYRYDWGDGSPAETGPEAVASHLYPVAGWLRVELQVEDACGRTSSAEAWAAVAEAGQLLRVGEALSLQDALSEAEARPGPQLVTFEAGTGPVSLGAQMLALEDPGEMLVGWGVTLDGSEGGWLEVRSPGGIVAGLELAGFTHERYGAVRLRGDGARAHGLLVRDSALGVALEGEGSALSDSVLRHNLLGQALVRARARLERLVVAEGEGTGIALDGPADGSELRLCQVWGQAGPGIVLDDDADAVSILDSTVAGNGGDGITVGRRVGELALRNVILAFNGGHGLEGEVESFAPGSPSHDLWFGNASPDCPGCSTLGLGSLTEDPQLADLSAGDLAPSPGSPALDAGTIETQTDRNGPSEGYFYGEGPEIGAIELR